MRSIFRIGCILVVIASLLVSGAMAETAGSSTVDAAVAQAENVTETAKEAAVTVGAAAAQAGNVTETVGSAAAAVGLTGVENLTESAKEATAMVGAAAAQAENLTESAQDVLAAVSGAEAGAAEPAAAAAAAVAAVTGAVEEPDLVNDTLVKFVTDARTFAVGSGKAAAMSAFSNPVGGYVTDDMYIFAYDYDGKALCLPYNPGMVGFNQIALSDSTGFRYVQQMRDTAKRGVGFVRYQESDMMNKGQIAEKVSYVTDVDGTYWIGAGVFVREEEQKPAAVVEAVTAAVSAAPDANVTAAPVGNLTAGAEAVVDAVQSAAENITA